jgi:hypothetical protein
MKTRRRRSLGALAATALAAVLLTACLQANEGATWLNTNVVATTVSGSPAGYIAYFGSPNLGITAQAALAMEATGRTAKLPLLLKYLEANESAYMDVPASGSTPAYVDAGHTALLILVAEATGTGQQFGDGGLSVALQQTLQQTGPNTGLFGANDATYDGVFRTALALQALKALNVPASSFPITAGLAWIKAQQCPSGGFSPDAALSPCSASPSSFQGADTNTTAQALLALADWQQPTGAGSPSARAVKWLASLETKKGSFPFYPGNTPDSNSTAIVSVALTAEGQHLSQGRWVKPGGRWPLQSLLAFQDTTKGSNFGGFFYQPGSLPDPLSTAQVSLALSGVPVPL